LDAFKAFYINKYADHHSHEIAFWIIIIFLGDSLPTGRRYRDSSHAGAPFMNQSFWWMGDPIRIFWNVIPKHYNSKTTTWILCV
jgi:hypothetical protein